MLQNRPGKRVTAASHRKGDNQVSDSAGLGDQGGNLGTGILFMVPSDLPHAPILTGPDPKECRHDISTGIFGYPNSQGTATIVEEARLWLGEDPDSSLTTVRFTAFDELTVGLFADEIRALATFVPNSRN